jgi:hypothetical protein
MEGKRSGAVAGALVQSFEQKQAKPLAELEAPWTQLPADEAAYAYAWALATIEYIVQVDGMGDVERILDRLASGGSTESAMRQILRDDYADISEATVHYLQKAYGK